MSIKEFLTRAYKVDKRINSKLEQVRSLRDLATKANATLSDAPKSGTPNFHRMENIIAKMIDLENEINSDIDELMNLKHDVIEAIKNVDNPEYQTLLEMRYLCFKKWEQIADDMGYEVRYLYKLHGRALSACDHALKKQDTKRH
jgi:hypothetical protein